MAALAQRKSPRARRSTVRKKCPTVLQMEAVECGAAALAMVLAHYGLWVSLEDLRVACGVSRDGSKASNVVKAARRYGLEAKGLRLETEGLIDQRFPLIVFWEFMHFVVVEGIKRGRFYINDPANGRRVMSWEEFDAGFTGIALTFAPTAEFRRGGEPPRLLRAFRRRLRGAGPAVAFLSFVSLGLIVPGLAIPTFSKVFVDDYLVQQLDGWLRPLLVGMGATLLLHAALTGLQLRYIRRLNIRLNRLTSTRLVWHVLQLPMTFFNQRQAGDVAARVQASTRLATLLSGQMASSVANLFSVIFFAAVMAMYDLLMTGVSLALIAVNVGVFRLLSERRDQISQNLINDDGRFFAEAINGIFAVETLKASGRESDFMAKLSGYFTKAVNGRQRIDLYDQFLNIAPTTLFALANATVLGLGGLRVMQGELTLGGILAFQALLMALNRPVEGLMSAAGDLQTLRGDLARIDDVLRYPAEPEVLIPGEHEPAAAPEGAARPAVEPPVPDRIEGRVDFRDVTFGYSPLDPPLIESFNLHMEPGARVALVGASGSGKSTIAKLLTGLYRPWQGKILLDGVPLESFPRRWLSESLASVDQEIFLFEGTVHENITLWDETIPNDEVVRAARDACIHEIVAARQAGYEGPVTEGGRNFSGGQAQRLEIARALVRNPKVLVLDEATSALDPSTEEEIDENLRRRGVTTLIVAHRLSTIRDCDEIIVLDHGKVVQRGTHESMKDVEGPYADLIGAQD